MAPPTPKPLDMTPPLVLPDVTGLRVDVGEIVLPASVDPEMFQLPDRKCVYAQLTVWTATDAPGGNVSAGATLSPTDNATYPVYYGFDRHLFAQLFPGFATQLMPIANLRQICVRGQKNVAFDQIVRWAAYYKP